MIVKKLFINDDVILSTQPYVKEITFDRIIEISLICNSAIYNVGEKSKLSPVFWVGEDR